MVPEAVGRRLGGSHSHSGGGDGGSNITPNSVDATGSIGSYADHIVQTKSDFDDLFPGTQGGSTSLSDGDTVVIDPDNPPIVYDRDHFLTDDQHVTILGTFSYGSPFDLKAADSLSASAKAFVVTGSNSRVRIEGLSHDGNRSGNSGNSNETPFVEVWDCDAVYCGFNYSENINPQSHNNNGDMFRVPGFASGGTNHYYYKNICDDPGDRMITMQDPDAVFAAWNKLTNGFDRMISLHGVHRATLLGNECGTLAEGSIFGVQGQGTPAASQRVEIIGNHAEGTYRNGVQIFGNNSTDRRTDDVTVAFNTFRKTADTSGSHYGISMDSTPGHVRRVTIVGNTFDGAGFDAGGIHVGALRVLSGFNTFIDVGTAIYDVVSGAGEPDLGTGDRWRNPPSTIINNPGNDTRGRWRGVMGGGPFGGVRLDNVNGQYNGDRSIADGGASGVSFGDIGVWDTSGTQWLAFNSDTTV